MEKAMTCKEAEKKIPAFIKNQLTYGELEKFIDHMEECPVCREEMSIQYLVAEGMVRLEDGGAFDLNKELNNLMENAKKKVRVHKGLQYLGIGLEIAALLAILTVILVMIL